MAYYKPQSPFRKGEDYFFPITTYDQIIMPDGNRWDGKAASDGENSATLFVNRYTLSLPSANWVLESEDGPYVQHVDVSGITTNDVLIADIDMSAVTKDTVGELKNNWALIDDCESSSDNVVKFICWQSAPEIDMSVKITAFSSSAIAASYPSAEEASF